MKPINNVESTGVHRNIIKLVKLSTPPHFNKQKFVIFIIMINGTFITSRSRLKKVGWIWMIEFFKKITESLAVGCWNNPIILGSYSFNYTIYLSPPFCHIESITLSCSYFGSSSEAWISSLGSEVYPVGVSLATCDNTETLKTIWT